MGTASENLTLEKLPKDLLADILDQIADVTDILSLCLVHPLIRPLADARLFHCAPVVIRAPTTSYGLSPSSDEHAAETEAEAGLSPPPARLRSARRLVILPECPEGRSCYHRPPVIQQPLGNDDDDDQDQDDAPPVAPDDRPRKLAAFLLQRLRSVRDGGLDHFSWESSSCIPDEILGPGGWLSTHHPNIQSLHIPLANFDACTLGPDREHTAASLPAFRRLRALTLRSIFPVAHPEFITVLTHNAATLESLSLSLALHRHTDTDYALHFPDQPAGNEPIRLTALRRLIVSSTSFTHRFWTYLVAAIDFNWHSLESLTIRHCANAAAFLDALADSATTAPLRLRTLDYCSFPRDAERPRSLDRLLASISGLEHAYLHLETAYSSTNDYLELLATHHGASLRTLVLENRQWSSMGVHAWPHDLNELAIKGIDAMAALRRQNPFLRMPNLTSLGLAARPDIFELVLQPFTGQPSPRLSLLHVRAPFLARATGSKAIYKAVRAGVQKAAAGTSTSAAAYCAAHPNPFFKFVNWLFDDSGVKSLELLAYGDFSGRVVPLSASFFIKRRAPCPDNPESPSWDFYSRPGGPKKEDWPFKTDRDSLLDSLIQANAEFLQTAPTWATGTNPNPLSDLSDDGGD